NQDTTIYVKVEILEFIKVGLVFMNQDVDSFYIMNSPVDEINISIIYDRLGDEINYPNIPGNVKLYYDPLLENEYNYEIIENDIIFFVTFDIATYNQVTFIFDKDVPTYNTQLLSILSINENMIKGYLRGYLSYYDFE